MPADLQSGQRPAAGADVSNGVLKEVAWLADAGERRGHIKDVAGRLAEWLAHVRAEFVVVIPPFASPDRPSLGGSIVAGTARKAGLEAAVLYANLSFARLVGPHRYRELCHTPTSVLFGERVFAPAYYGAAACHPATTCSEELGSLGDLPLLQEAAAEWAEAVATVLAADGCRFVGFSTTFEQTLSSLSLVQRLKRLAPGKVVLVGGANADGEMGTALAALEPGIDHVFSGEAEVHLAHFFAQQRDRPEGMATGRVVACAPAPSLEEDECPDYADFFEQLALLLTDVQDGTPPDLHLPYESSRGCWWGAKHHCTFCGLNANGMQFRQKSSPKVLRECAALVERHRVEYVVMTDNIMPSGYFSTLLPELKAAERSFTLFYEQKANITRERMRSLREARVLRIQPGIESLSTPVLRLMNKGTTAAINIDCLRFARSEGIDVAWNLLCDFPGDQEADYSAMTELAPLLQHLQPPSGVAPLMVDRFSPYFDRPDAFGITSIKPLPAYATVHVGVPADRIRAMAYHFEAEYDSAKRRSPDVVMRLAAVVDTWKASWAEGGVVPEFRLFPLSDGRWLLLDTRACRVDDARVLGPGEAHLVTAGERSYSADVKAALDRRELAQVDGVFRPLVVPLNDVDVR